jgi:hypothetical protein
MLDLNIISKRYFDVKLGDYTLQLEPCSLKTLRKLSEVDSKTTFAELVNLVATILNKNKTNFKTPIEVVESITIPQMTALLGGYMEWVADEKAKDPN